MAPACSASSSPRRLRISTNGPLEAFPFGRCRPLQDGVFGVLAAGLAAMARHDLLSPGDECPAGDRARHGRRGRHRLWLISSMKLFQYQDTATCILVILRDGAADRPRIVAYSRHDPLKRAGRGIAARGGSCARPVKAPSASSPYLKAILGVREETTRFARGSNRGSITRTIAAADPTSPATGRSTNSRTRQPSSSASTAPSPATSSARSTQGLAPNFARLMKDGANLTRALGDPELHQPEQHVDHHRPPAGGARHRRQLFLRPRDRARK